MIARTCSSPCQRVRWPSCRRWSWIVPARDFLRSFDPSRHVLGSAANVWPSVEIGPTTPWTAPLPVHRDGRVTGGPGDLLHLLRRPQGTQRERPEAAVRARHARAMHHGDVPAGRLHAVPRVPCGPPRRPHDGAGHDGPGDPVFPSWIIRGVSPVGITGLRYRPRLCSSY